MRTDAQGSTRVSSRLVKRLSQAGLLTVLLVLMCPVVRAQHEDAGERAEKGAEAVTEGEGGLQFWAWANFALLSAGLIYVFRKNAFPYFAQRAIGIRKGMVEADEARANAERRIAAVEARLGNLMSDIQSLKDAALAEARSEHERVRQETTAEIAKIRHNAEQEIASAGKAARAELKRYSASLAVSVAAEKIRARMNAATQDGLVRGFVRNLTGAVQ
jgi:F0F1-type ATP synthase membrane subunit b/b'